VHHPPATGRVCLRGLAEAALWARLQEAGVLRVDLALVSFPEWMPQYDWLRGQMARRPPGYSGGHPWWAWAAPKPDLRETRRHFGAPGYPLVRLELAIPVAEVLCFDFQAWHRPLASHYLSVSDQEDDAWEPRPSTPGRAR
jgi:hypothetical protein